MKNYTIRLSLALLLITVFSKAQVIPNGGFENWIKVCYQLQEWKTNSFPCIDPPYDPYVVKQDNDACEGSYAVKLIANGVFRATAETKFPVTNIPLKLNACVKTTIGESDSVMIAVSVSKKGNLVAAGQWVNKQAITDYTRIIIPIDELIISNPPTIPDSITIKITGGIDAATNLFVDSLFFEPVISTQTDDIIYSDNIHVFPNPFIDKVTLNSSNNNQPLMVTILDITGKIYVQQELKKNNATIDLSFLEAGLYMIVTQNSSTITTLPLIKVH